MRTFQPGPINALYSVAAVVVFFLTGGLGFADESGSQIEAAVAEGPDTVSVESSAKEFFSRKVSLTADAMPLSEVLVNLARQAQVELELDAAALKKAGVDIEQPLTVAIKDQPLGEALQELVTSDEQHMVFCRWRAGKLFISTFEAETEYTQRHLPAWLQPHFGSHLSATLDDDDNVVAIYAGRSMTDELLAQLATLPKLRKLHLEGPVKLTAAGMVQFGRLSSLEKLSLFSLTADGSWLGDAVIGHVAGLPSLQELSLNMCGTTDAGVKMLAGKLQLRDLSLQDEGRLSDAALESIASLKHLKRLKLRAMGGTDQLGKMRFSEDAVRRLAELTDLEELDLVGQPVPADAIVWSRLKTLSLGWDATDDAAARIATLRRLTSLELFFTRVTDTGLQKIADLPALCHLSLYSHYVTDAGVGELAKLVHLRFILLRGWYFTDRSIGTLAGMKSLRRIDLHGHERPFSQLPPCFSISAVRQLKALPELHTLWLDGFGSGDYAGLKDLIHLRGLILLNTAARDEDVRILEEALPDARISKSNGEKIIKLPAKPIIRPAILLPSQDECE